MNPFCQHGLTDLEHIRALLGNHCVPRHVRFAQVQVIARNMTTPDVQIRIYAAMDKPDARKRELAAAEWAIKAHGMRADRTYPQNDTDSFGFQSKANLRPSL